MTKKIFAMFLAVLMVVSMLPTSVFAADGCPGQGYQHTKSNCDNWTKLNTTAPTCGKEGFTTYRCNECGQEFMDDIVAPTEQHSMVPSQNGKPATCITDGYEPGTECENCDYVIPGKVIPAVGKPGTTACEYGEWTTNPIDCTVGGFQDRYCAFCKQPDPNRLVVEKHPAHSWSAWKLTVAATETTPGEAVRECTCAYCPATETIVVYFPHDCVIDYFAQVDHTCFEDGMKEYHECRVCNIKYKWAMTYDKDGNELDMDFVAMTEAEIAALVIPAEHTYEAGKEPTCKKPTAWCVKCEAWITETNEKFVGHNWVEDTTNFVAPTCNRVGLKMYKCTICAISTHETLEPLGHLTYTLGGAATCGTYSYTFDVCLRPGCDSLSLEEIDPDCIYTDSFGKRFYEDTDGRHYDLTVESVPMVAPVVDVPLTLVLEHGKLNKTGYFTGNGYSSKYYLPLSEDAADAVTVYLEAVGEDGYYMYFYDTTSDVKTYITMIQSGYYTNAKYVTETPAAPFKWNKELGALTMTFENGEYVLSSRANRNYFNLDCREVTEDLFVAQLFVGIAGTPHIYNITINYAAGFDHANHMVEEKINSYPTCTTVGEKFRYCGNWECTSDWYEIVSIPKLDHNWVEATEGDLRNESIVPPTALTVQPTCEKAGYQWRICLDCDHLWKEEAEYAATGHDFLTYWENNEEKVVTGTFPGSHTELAYDYKVCKNSHCDHSANVYTDENGDVLGCEVRTNYRKPTSILNTTWTTFAEAEAVHGKGNLEYRGVYIPGSCTTQGVLRYECLDDDCLSTWVYVVQYLPYKDASGNLTTEEFITGAHVADTAVCIDPTCPYNSCQVENCPNAQDGNTCTDSTHFKQGTCPLNQAPTCTEAGWTRTYKCDRCGKTIGSTRVGYHNWIAPTGHNMVANENYVKAPCGEPIFSADNFVSSCSNAGCTHKEYDGTELLGDFMMYDPNNDGVADQWESLYGFMYGADYCTNYYTYSTYKCHCGEVHAFNFVPLTHKWIEKENGVKYDATCYAVGHVDLICQFCGVDADNTDEGWREIIAKVPHTNKDGVQFTTDCTVYVADRHCVVCHKYGLDMDHDEMGEDHDCYTYLDENGNPCGCIIEIEHKMSGSPVFYDSTCTTVPYWMDICDACNKETADAFTKYVTSWAQNANGEWIPASYAPIALQGCQPTEAEWDPVKQEYIRYAAYDYFWFQPISYKVISYVVTEGEGENAKQVTYYAAEIVYGTPYLAQVDEYVEETFLTEGHWIGTCRVCGKDDTHIIPVKTGLDFELEVENTNGADEMAVGSLIEVTVYANSAGEDIYSFLFDVDAVDMIFVGYEVVNDQFNLTVTEPLMADREFITEDYLTGNGSSELHFVGGLTISGTAVNNASGLRQNVTIGEKTPLVKLLFRSVKNIYGMNYVVLGNGVSYELDSLYVETPIYCDYDDEFFFVRDMLDFNNDGFAHVTDIYQAESMLTGEHPDGKTYDVTVDVDKDGKVSGKDLDLIYQLVVGNVSEFDLFMTGIEEAEAEFLLEVLDLMTGHYCYSCGEKLVGNEIYCPVCGLKQP